VLQLVQSSVRGWGTALACPRVRLAARPCTL